MRNQSASSAACIVRIKRKEEGENKRNEATVTLRAGEMAKVYEIGIQPLDQKNRL